MIRAGLKNAALLAAVLVGLGGMATASQAAPIAFASFQQTDSGASAWTFTNTGVAATTTFSVSGLPVNFLGSPPPNQILDFVNLFAGTNGSVLVSLTSHAGGIATSAGLGQPISQPLAAGADLKFVNASNASDVILDVVFSGSITGTTGGSGSLAAATLAGQAISYSSNHLLGTFNPPFSFSLSLNPAAGLTLNANNFLNSFTTVSSGTFVTNGGSGAGQTPLPAAVWGGLSLIGALGGMQVVRRRRA